MYLQLLRIFSVSTSKKNSMSSYRSYYKKAGERGNTSSSNYYRLFLFRDLSSKERQVCYIIEGKAQNDKLWRRFSQLCDDGNISIGTIISVLNPKPITQWYINDIPIVEVPGGCIVNKNHLSYKKFLLTILFLIMWQVVLLGMELKLTF